MTAEAALVLPLLVALTVALTWLLSLGISQARVVDAARETARALARDDDSGTAAALGRRVAPEGARIVVTRDAGAVVVTVSATVAGPGGLLEGLPGVEITARAVAAPEELPGTGPG